jgi:hypothetical protein
VGPGEVLVGRLRRALDLEQGEVLLQELGHRGRGTRVPILIDLNQQAAERLLRVGSSVRAGWDVPAEVEPPLRQWVLSGIDLRPERAAAGQL